jgi:outer membrane protein assembly factor BamB
LLARALPAAKISASSCYLNLLPPFYSGPAIVAGKLFTMGTRDNSEIVLALDANTGKDLWRASGGGIFDEKRGSGPRRTPTIAGDRVYAMTGIGNVVCIDAADGKIVWQQAMTGLGGEVPHWGYTESVLVNGNHVICTPGGSKGAIAALDKVTGRVVWQSAAFTDDAQYSSIVAVKINGASQYVQLTMKNPGFTAVAVLTLALIRVEADQFASIRGFLLNGHG